MNLNKIKLDILKAQRHFDYVEAHVTETGRLMALCAIQTSRRLYTFAVTFPETYPYKMPDVFVRKPVLIKNPHQYLDGSICYMHPNVWNPGRCDLLFVIARVAKWLAKYEVYLERGRWPGASIPH